MKQQDPGQRSVLAGALSVGQAVARAITITAFIGSVICAALWACFAVFLTISSVAALTFETQPLPVPTNLLEAGKFFAPALIPAFALLFAAFLFRLIELLMAPAPTSEVGNE